MIAVRFDNNGKVYESLSAPVLNAEGNLVVVAVVIETGEISTIKVDDIKQLIRPDMPKLDS